MSIFTKSLLLASLLPLSVACGDKKSDDSSSDENPDPTQVVSGENPDTGGGSDGDTPPVDATPVKDPRADFTNCKLPIADGRGGAAIGGFPRYPERLPSIGTVNATVIMVDFSDSPAVMTPSAAFAMISGATATFTSQSYNRFTYNLTPALHWYRMSKPSTDYSFSAGAHIDYVREAVALADADVDFSQTDSLIILANPDTTAFSQGPALLASAGGGATADGNEMLNIVTSGHDLNNWGSIWLNHEVTHTLGLVDLYAYDAKDAANPYDILRFAGLFSYMAYNGFDGVPNLLAWERYVLGWLDDAQISCSNPFRDGEINQVLTPIGQAGGLKAVVVPLSATKALVVESRRVAGIDVNLRKAGALVYVVDSSIQSGKGAVKVYPASADDPLFFEAPRAEGETVDVEGMTIEVVSSTAGGDSVRITAIK